MDAMQDFRANRSLAFNAWRLRYGAMVAAALGGSARSRRQAAALFDLLHEKRYAFHRSLEPPAVAGDSGFEACKARVETAWAALLDATEEVASRLELIASIQEREHPHRFHHQAPAGDRARRGGDAAVATRVRAGAG